MAKRRKCGGETTFLSVDDPEGRSVGRMGEKWKKEFEWMGKGEEREASSVQRKGRGQREGTGRNEQRQESGRNSVV